MKREAHPKRWRLDTRPATAGALCGATFGPWKSTVEVHQVCCVFGTDATVANRFVTLRHSLIAPAIVLAEIPMNTSAIIASTDSSTMTWGQGFNNITQSVSSTVVNRTSFLPFAFILSVGEQLQIVVTNPQVGDTLSSAVIMVRDLFDGPFGR